MLIQISLELLQLKVGISCPILQADFDQWGGLAMPCWLHLLWAFTHKATICLSSTTPYVPQPQWQGNQFLMDLIGSFNLPQNELATFNRCCLAHRVLFLLHITDGWGHSLFEPILQPLLQPPQSSWHWLHATMAAKDWHLATVLAAHCPLNFTWYKDPIHPTNNPSVPLIHSLGRHSFQVMVNFGIISAQDLFRVCKTCLLLPKMPFPSIFPLCSPTPGSAFTPVSISTCRGIISTFQIWPYQTYRTWPYYIPLPSRQHIPHQCLL